MEHDWISILSFMAGAMVAIASILLSYWLFTRQQQRNKEMGEVAQKVLDRLCPEKPEYPYGSARRPMTAYSPFSPGPSSPVNPVGLGGSNANQNNTIV